MKRNPRSTDFLFVRTIGWRACTLLIVTSASDPIRTRAYALKPFQHVIPWGIARPQAISPSGNLGTQHFKNGSYSRVID